MRTKSRRMRRRPGFRPGRQFEGATVAGTLSHVSRPTAAALPPRVSGVVGRLVAVLVVVGIVLGTSWYVKTQVVDEAVDDAKAAFGVSGDLAPAPTLRGDD